MGTVVSLRSVAVPTARNVADATAAVEAAQEVVRAARADVELKGRDFDTAVRRLHEAADVLRRQTNALTAALHHDARGAGDAALNALREANEALHAADDLYPEGA